MPRDNSITSVLVIGSGPIVIGQACEFDYSGTQACRLLRSEGIRVILINSNPATIMTDPEFADATYIEPITPEVIEKILEKEELESIDLELELEEINSEINDELNSKEIKLEEFIIVIQKELELNKENDKLKEYCKNVYILFINKYNLLVKIQNNIKKIRKVVKDEKKRKEYKEELKIKETEKQNVKKFLMKINNFFDFTPKEVFTKKSFSSKTSKRTKLYYKPFVKGELSPIIEGSKESNSKSLSKSKGGKKTRKIKKI